MCTPLGRGLEITLGNPLPTRVRVSIILNKKIYKKINSFLITLLSLLFLILFILIKNDCDKLIKSIKQEKNNTNK